MGIRKHLEEHPGETKLADLSLEQESEDLNFNAEKDLTDQDWELLEKDLREARRSGDIDFITRLIAIDIIGPQKAKKLLDYALYSRLGDTLEGYMKRELDFLEQSSEENKFFMSLSAITESLVGLKKFYNENYELTEHQWFWILHEIDSKKEMFWSQFRRAAFMLTISFPEKAKQIDFTGHDFDRFNKDIEQYRRQKKWEEFAKIAMVAKVLFPEQSKSIKLDNQAWQGILDILEIYRKGEFEDDRDDVESPEWWNIEWHIAAMQILAADEVEITDQGLKLTMPKQDLKQQKAKRPERRQF